MRYAPERIELASLIFDSGPVLWGYRLETVAAEKLERIITLGLVNGRIKDYYYDLYRIAEVLYEDDLIRALVATFRRRHTMPDPAPPGLGPDFATADDKIEMWCAFLDRNDLVARAELLVVLPSSELVKSRCLRSRRLARRPNRPIQVGMSLA